MQRKEVHVPARSANQNLGEHFTLTPGPHGGADVARVIVNDKEGKNSSVTSRRHYESVEQARADAFRG